MMPELPGTHFLISFYAQIGRTELAARYWSRDSTDRVCAARDLWALAGRA